MHWLFVSFCLIDVGIFFKCIFLCDYKQPLLLSLVFQIRIYSAKVDWKWLLNSKLDIKSQSKWGEYHWPECHICGTIKAFGCFVFSVAWGGSLDVAAPPPKVHASFTFFVFVKGGILLCLNFFVPDFKLPIHQIEMQNVFSEVKHYFKRMDYLQRKWF